MDRFDARRTDALPHGGTFNGNPIAAAAGLATLRELTPAAYARLDALGARLAERVGTGVAASGLAEQVGIVHDASLFEVTLGDGRDDLFLALLLEGYWIAPRGMGALSTPMTDSDVDDFADAFVGVARELQAGDG